MKSALCLLQIFLLLLTAGPAFAAQPGDGFLRVDGPRVVNAAGEEVVLRGLNVEFRSFFDTLAPDDIARIAGMGANVIRLALDYRDFEPEPFSYRRESFALLDRILDWCRLHGVYVILDMHLAPGKQNPHDFVVHRQNQARFWIEPENQERFYALWVELARRYRDDPVIAGYDLLNEGTPGTIERYREVMTTVAARIREVDPNHMLIVEEAILPDWEKRLILLDDPNVLYSIHFFHPPQFAFYSTTSYRPVTTYPGEMFKAGPLIASARAEIGPEEAEEWRKIEVRGVAPEGADLLLATIYSENPGQIWFDDLKLEAAGREIELPAPLVANNAFAIDYPGFNWRTDGDCVLFDEYRARNGGRSLLFADCRQPATARSSPIQVVPGEYRLSGWYRSAEAGSGNGGLALNWHRQVTIGQINRQELVEQMAYALDFMREHGVPLYVGEFTMHTNPWPDSARRYLHDLLTIMEEAGLHWTFWVYYSPFAGVGLFRDDPPVPGNPVALEVLGDYFRPGRFLSEPASANALE
ncbi:glycoside hydrolase family 5 protein [Desulfurivibrio alkaliphilus]|uniref:Glycoside hydrolase family 5 n=1 Tax=Desulfurivibrio alkaliphilus (strain DSM 19089 / UNIQEM U267 / AHT2) TaxID=589865 RepID=D6Z2E6_DESAT|nr:cellulase family glycosylhydrolase [Desulfurivibrio alkaliphilus]ADH85721.1 glycoside hydrolase family 5 [Desulfurivibrio alkaliphilus AHT 2]